MKKLIINADEFGLTEETNRAIIEAYQFGTVTSTTMIVNMWAFEDAIKRAKENPGLGVGIHLNVTDGRPILPPEKVLTLVGQDGFFTNRRSLWGKVMFSKVSLLQIEIELKGQIEKIKSSGINMTHIDVHQAVDLHPKIFSIILKLGVELGIPIRITRQGLLFKGLDKKRSLKRCISRIVCGRYIRLANLAKVPHTDYFFKLGDFDPSANANLVERCKLILSSLKEGVFELMVHPAYLDGNLVKFMNNCLVSAEKRQEELYLLLNPVVKEIITNYKISLINFIDLRVH